MKFTELWRACAILLLLLAAAANALLYSPSVSDLYPIWNGTRALFRGVSPYSARITADNRARFRSLTAEFPQDEQRFAYPLHATYIFVPFALLPFSIAVIAFTLVGAALTAWSVKWWAGAFRADYAALFLAAYPVMLGLSIQQPTILFAAIIAAAIHSMRTDRPRAAGILLAVATGKPQLLLGVLLPFAFWVRDDWKQRKALVTWFCLILVPAVVVSLAIEPRWPAEWLATLHSYPSYAPTSLPVALLGQHLGLTMSVIALGFAAAACWNARHNWQEALAISISTFVVILPFQPYNEIMLVGPIVWLAAKGSKPLPLELLFLRVALLGVFSMTIFAVFIETAAPSTVHPMQVVLGGFTRMLPIWCFVAVLKAASSQRNLRAVEQSAAVSSGK